ncbi:hypothetical protein [Streptococcus sp. sy010]|uniref:hypothetical protein n=1 Tax=Streptococcus sp. sy010 TaxID=2600148 RepID=UPI0011B3B7D9|nr:hypothetical protein [Streptococcus sp. sy010]TWT16439.1 hypothetical protein FRX51_00560 [Streptococcus sp. sy010]
MEWIKIETRPLTDEEKEINPNLDFMYDCKMPKIGEIVLVTTSYGNVNIDALIDYGYSGIGFSEYDDVIAWMPLPKPFRKE